MALSDSRLSRRRALQLAGLSAAGLALGPWKSALSVPLATAASALPTPDEALQLLVEGNQRWAAGLSERPNQDLERRAELATGQQPFAIVFSCVDSRVPPELVFDRGLGDLFVVRTAGQVIDDTALGSIEFGVEELHIPLVLVMGHERCGAVAATLEAIDHEAEPPGRIGTLVAGIRPAVEATRGLPGDPLDNAVRENTRSAAHCLRGARPILDELVSHGSVMVVGGRYDLRTGLVEIIA
jgi:carbonic anhydrase